VEHKAGIGGAVATLLVSGFAFYHREKIINYLKKKL
jgi:hypothetical protein